MDRWNSIKYDLSLPHVTFHRPPPTEIPCHRGIKSRLRISGRRFPFRPVPNYKSNRPDRSRSSVANWMSCADAEPTRWMCSQSISGWTIDRPRQQPAMMGESCCGRERKGNSQPCSGYPVPNPGKNPKIIGTAFIQFTFAKTIRTGIFKCFVIHAKSVKWCSSN